MTTLHLIAYITYLALALLFLAARSMFCLFLRKRFDFPVELLGAMVWPLSATYWIAMASADTRKYPRHW